MNLRTAHRIAAWTLLWTGLIVGVSAVPSAFRYAVALDAAAVDRHEEAKVAEFFAQEENVADELARLGHLPQADAEGRAAIHDRAAIAEGARSFLDFHGLPQASDPIAAVGAFLEAAPPRCGLPDIMPVKLAEGPQEARAAWPSPPAPNIRHWDGIGALSGVTPDQKHAAYVAAIESWEKVSGLQGELVNTKGEAHIASEAARIDRAGSVLAWSQLPNGSPNVRLQQTYDTSENWNPTFLQEVMAHELGHAYGLPHSRAGNLMQPYATSKIVVPQAGDIAEIQARYGPPVKQPEPTPTPTPVPAPEPTPQPTPQPEPTPMPHPGPDSVSGEIRINGKPYSLVPAAGTPTPAPQPTPVPAPSPAPAGPSIGERLAGWGITSANLNLALSVFLAGLLGSAKLKSKAAPK